MAEASEGDTPLDGLRWSIRTGVLHILLWLIENSIRRRSGGRNKRYQEDWMSREKGRSQSCQRCVSQSRLQEGGRGRCVSVCKSRTHTHTF